MWILASFLIAGAVATVLSKVSSTQIMDRTWRMSVLFGFVAGLTAAFLIRVSGFTVAGESPFFIAGILGIVLVGSIVRGIQSSPKPGKGL